MSGSGSLHCRVIKHGLVGGIRLTGGTVRSAVSVRSTDLGWPYFLTTFSGDRGTASYITLIALGESPATGPRTGAGDIATLNNPFVD